MFKGNRKQWFKGKCRFRLRFSCSGKHFMLNAKERLKQKSAPGVSYFSAERIFSNRAGLSGSQATVNASQSGLSENVSLSLA